MQYEGQCQYKVVLLGESGVGKSNIAHQFAKHQFNEFQESTVGAAFFTQTVAVSGMTVKFEIWDTAGQERYKALTPMYYRNAQAAIVVYDITNQHSFTEAQYWIDELKSKAHSLCIVVLAGNKTDLRVDRKVSQADAQTFADQNDLFFMEISAKVYANVHDLFLEIARRLHEMESVPRLGLTVANKHKSESECCRS